MFEIPTEEQIYNRLISRFIDLAGLMSVDEGTIPYNILKPVSMDLAEAYRFIKALYSALWVDDAEDDNLDLAVSIAGVIRKEATKAKLKEAKLKLMGTPGGVIPSLTQFMTEGTSPLFFVTTGVTILDSTGVGYSILESETPGVIGNIPSGTVLLPVNSINGLQTIELVASLEGGTDRESDNELRERYKQKVRRRATSGNAGHYIEWALEVSGVTAARVYENLDGPNTVRVVLLGQNGLPPDSTVVEATRNYILTQRPLGPGDDGIFVISAAPKTFDIAAKVKLSKNIGIGDVKPPFEVLLKEYYRELTESSDASQSTRSIVLTKIGALLHGINGVDDYGELTINGLPSNQTFEPDEIPIVGTVTLEVMT